jgi:hypothetical protein
MSLTLMMFFHLELHLLVAVVAVVVLVVGNIDDVLVDEVQRLLDVNDKHHL